MRDLKFRIYCDPYDDINKRMFYDGIWFDDDGWYIENGWYYLDDLMFDNWLEEPCKCKVMQFTWLLDKNWKEIYEGDIYHQGDSRILYIVEWLDTGLKGRQNWNKSTAWISHFQSDIEVIWNIYESPDLIK